MRRRYFCILLLFLPLLLAQPAAADERIIGSNPATPGEFPWSAAIVDKKESAYWGQYCGGSLIHPRWVITSALCVEGMRASQIDVVLGRADLRKRDGERIAVVDIKKNQGGVDGVSDAALLYLAHESSITPIALEENGPWISGKATILGWGAKKTFHPYRLQKAEIDFLPYKECEKAYQDFYDIKVMYCAGREDASVDACWEDMGGAMLFEGKLLGLVSWRDVCADPDFPGVYTRLPTIHDWIQYNLENPPTDYENIPPGKDHNRKPKPYVDFLSVGINSTEPQSVDNQYIIFVESNYRILRSQFILKSEKSSFFCEEDLIYCVKGNRWYRQKRGYGNLFALSNFTVSNERCPSIRMRVHIQNNRKRLWRWREDNIGICDGKRNVHIKRVRLK